MPDPTETQSDQQARVALAYTMWQMRDKHRRDAFAGWVVLLTVMAFLGVPVLALWLWWARLCMGWAWGG